jgi:hypothetical protein
MNMDILGVSLMHALMILGEGQKLCLQASKSASQAAAISRVSSLQSGAKGLEIEIRSQMTMRVPVIQISPLVLETLPHRRRRKAPWGDSQARLYRC